jgi:DNA-binding transcriptional LysR family regulator
MPSSSSWYDSGSEAPECVARAGDVATRIGALPESELIARKLSAECSVACPRRPAWRATTRYRSDRLERSCVPGIFPDRWEGRLALRCADRKHLSAKVRTFVNFLEAALAA